MKDIEIKELKKQIEQLQTNKNYYAFSCTIRTRRHKRKI
jgi:hypothetical protein